MAERVRRRRLSYDAPPWDEDALRGGSLRTNSWDLQPGTVIKRTDLHDRYGGRRQGGIGVSARTPNVLVFTDKRTGARYGYNDRWDGPVFHYTGEGQMGDQRMASGNQAILGHASDGRSLRLFKGVRGVVRYEGEFVLDEEEAWYFAHAPDRNGNLRKVVVFRLRAAELPYPLPTSSYEVAREERASFGRGSNPVNEDVASSRPAPFEIDPNVIDRGTRGHNRTQNLLRAFVESKGIRTLQPDPAAGDPDFDLGWIRKGVWFVVEVKSLTTSNEARQLRLALGQVLDYEDRLLRRHDSVKAVIATEEPVNDRRWVALCERHGVLLVWPDVFDAVLSPVLAS